MCQVTIGLQIIFQHFLEIKLNLGKCFDSFDISNFKSSTLLALFQKCNKFLNSSIFILIFLEINFQITRCWKNFVLNLTLSRNFLCEKIRSFILFLLTLGYGVKNNFFKNFCIYFLFFLEIVDSDWCFRVVAK